MCDYIHFLDLVSIKNRYYCKQSVQLAAQLLVKFLHQQAAAKLSQQATLDNQQSWSHDRQSDGIYNTRFKWL